MRARSARSSTKKPRKTAAAPAAIPVAPAPGPTVVGLGASAGGLEAFEEFFRHVEPDSGIAYVMVPHLDPSHESILTEIVQRSTALPVVEVTDRLAVKPDHVYVIPPNRDLTLFHGVLQLAVPETPRGQRMPIDAFFRSLAEDQGDRAIGVVLSGTGTDGSLGLRAILGAGGVTFVQDPATAKYDGMPAAAIRSGYAAHVLPVARMPEMMRSISRAAGTRRITAQSPVVARGLTQILATLRSRTGHDFSQYKKSTVVRRIERRMAQHEIDRPEAYARYLKEHPVEVQLLFRELLINVTSFFRDPEAFEVLRDEILPRMLQGKPEGFTLRAWVAGCASGEEAYSLAIILRERLDEVRSDVKAQIYATDLDDEAITAARAGAYSPNIVQDVSPERLRRFFVKEEGGYRVKKEIREMVVFAVQDIIKDPPFTRIDLVACRNLMIYLEPELQDRLIATFHYALRPGGILFLSPSESLGHPVGLFRVLNRRWKLFEAVPSVTMARIGPVGMRHLAGPDLPAPPGQATRKAKAADVADLTNRALLESFAPVAVVTDLSGNIVYVHGDTGRYLRPAPGKPTLNVLEMARGGLEAELRAVFHAAVRRGAPTRVREVPTRIDGAVQPVLLTVRPLGPRDAEAGLLLVTFQDRPRAARAKGVAQRGPGRSGEGRRVKELEAAIAYSKALLRTTMEEQQASTEELKSTNEELQSTNEELQSTNEELETSKEELQSVNEELVTVNAELQAKIDQLAGMQNDMRNLLDNVSGGLIFLDGSLLIRRFTRDATKVFRLVATDVGRPLADIKGEVEGDSLIAGAQAVLDTLVPWERELTAATGSSYLARIQPYRTVDNVIDGVVMTFADITARVAAEAAVRESRRVAQSIVDTVREPLVVLDAELKVASASRAFYEGFRVTAEETLGRPFSALGDGQWDVPALRKLLEAVQAGREPFDDFAVEREFPRVGHRRLLLSGRGIPGEGSRPPMVLLAIEFPRGIPSNPDGGSSARLLE
jgi:two-component system CheB/CheR fusion protein